MPNPTDAPVLHTLEETWTLLRVSRANLYRIIANGDLAVVHQGRRAYVTDTELSRYLAALEDPDHAA